MKLISYLSILFSLTFISNVSAQSYWFGDSISIGGGETIVANSLFSTGIQGQFGQEDLIAELDGRMDFGIGVSPSNLAQGEEVLTFDIAAKLLWKVEYLLSDLINEEKRVEFTGDDKLSFIPYFGAGPRALVLFQKQDTVGFLGLTALVGTEARFDNIGIFLELDVSSPMYTLEGARTHYATFTLIYPKLSLGVNYYF